MIRSDRLAAAIMALVSSRPSDQPPDVSAAPGDATTPPRALPAYHYWVALTALVMVSVGFGAIAPSLATILEELGVTASLGALLVAALGAGRLLGGFPAGLVVSRIGPGRVVLLGSCVFIVGSVAAWLAPSFPALALGRLVQGVALGIVPAGVLAAVMMGAKAERAGGSMALYQSALTLGSAFGPAVGGPLADHFGWRASLLFCVVVGVACLGICLPLGMRQARLPAAPPKPRERLGWAGAAAVAVVLVPHLATFVFRSNVSQLALPLYAAGPGGMDPSMVGLLLGSQAVMTLAMLGPAGWATNRFGLRRVLGSALIVTATSVALMPIVPSPYGLWAATIIFGAGMAVLGVAAGLFIFTLAGYSTSALVAVYRLTGDLVQVFGPAALGPILDSLGFKVSFWMLAACGFLAVFSLLRRSPPVGGRQ
jgi:MFS family permease